MQPLIRELPSEVVKSWSELEAQYVTGLFAWEFRLVLAMEASGALVTDEAFSDLEVLERNQGQASLSAEQLMELFSVLLP